MMPARWIHRFLIGGVFILSFVPAGRAAEPLRYELRFEKPNTHLMDITIRAGGLTGPAAEFAMPDWAPGAYFIENYAAAVQGFSATGPDDQPLVWRKRDSQTWSIELSGATSVTVRYQIYANTLQNNNAQYNDRHAFIGGPAVWMYLVGGKDRPIELRVAVPANWKVATGMSRTPQNTFTAADYDWFADSPIEISDFAERDFQVAGTTYHVVVHDVMGRRDFSKFTSDTQKFVDAIVPIFAPVTGTPQPAPFADYWFIFHIWPQAGGGLEHLNSTQTNYAQDWDVTTPAPDFGTVYERKLYVAAHEFFHAWNVKRLRPKPLGPFDYSQMVHTPSLWISEGLTSYYAALALVHAGLITPEQYLHNISRQITKFEQEPGRKERSIEDTSWDTWFRSPKTFSDLDNTWYSYYDGGQIAGHLLDFAIREQTNNQKSLDDWMRLLYQRYALPKPGFEPEDAVRAASEVAGADMSDFFHRYISGKEPLPYEKYFEYAGIAVQKVYDPNAAWLGVATERNEDGRARIKNVIPGSPAEVAGLDRDDVILVVDGRAVDQEGFEAAIAERSPGNPVRITLLRLGELKEISLTLGASPYATYLLQPVVHPTDLQRRIFRSWIGLK
jgi:predicted metalloprotease with PDZ domain